MRREGGKAWFWRWWWLSLIGALSLISGAAHAALDAPTQRGLDWLSTQIQANGQLSGERTSAALPIQVRSEAALALRALSQTVPPALFSAIDGVQPDTTEYLARKALAKQLAGASDAAALNALEPMQNADGGFGAATGLASNPQDTAWALRALHANRKSGVSATKALAWVQSNQQSEGSWKLVPDGDTLVPTALMAQTLVLYRYQQTSTQAALTKAQTWLVSQRNAAQTWADEQRTAQGLLAVLPGLDAFTTMEPTLAALRQSQRADGSWAGDPYVTALALRALALAALGPQNPGDPVTTGTLQGTTQGANGQPLAGVVVAAVSAAGGAPKLATSDAQGNYAITGIPAGPVSISAAKDGYSQINASGTIVAGQVLMFSPVLTSVVTVTPPGTPPPQGTTTATVSGKASKADIGAPSKHRHR